MRLGVIEYAEVIQPFDEFIKLIHFCSPHFELRSTFRATGVSST